MISKEKAKAQAKAQTKEKAKEKAKAQAKAEKTKQKQQKEGFLKILSLKSNLNNGLSKTLIAEFPEMKLIKRPLLELNTCASE
jgi:hypothetical protein